MQNKKFILGLVSVAITFGLLLVTNSCKETSSVACNLPETVSYTENIAPLIEEKCFKCHAEEVYKQKASRNKIYTYESLREKAEGGILMGSLTHQKGYIAMPYKMGKKIDTCSIALIGKWVTTGMKK